MTCNRSLHFPNRQNLRTPPEAGGYSTVRRSREVLRAAVKHPIPDLPIAKSILRWRQALRRMKSILRSPEFQPSVLCASDPRIVVVAAQCLDEKTNRWTNSGRQHGRSTPCPFGHSINQEDGFSQGHRDTEKLRGRRARAGTGHGFHSIDLLKSIR